MRKKIIIILILVSLIMFGANATYSYFSSNVLVSTIDQKIAKFIFESESLDNLTIPLSNMSPGDSKEILFNVSNSKNSLISDVTIEYVITLNTPHYIPLIIELYKDDSKIMTCDESYSRNENNEIVCHTKPYELSKENKMMDNYKLKITYDKKYNDYSYSELIDYINIELKSYQKV